MKTHWLYGRGPEKRLTFVKEVDTESNCGECSHSKVCGRVMEERCENFEFGTSAGKGCHACLHRHTRFDRESVPCFACRDFAPILEVEAKGG